MARLMLAQSPTCRATAREEQFVKAWTCSRASAGRFCSMSCDKASIRLFPLSGHDFLPLFSANRKDIITEATATRAQSDMTIIPNSRICLKDVSMFFNDLNSIILVSECFIRIGVCGVSHPPSSRCRAFIYLRFLYTPIHTSPDCLKPADSLE